jgi:Glu-tRNA(Gln) amidotransferase subunit E-like FAD-binding protein
MAESKEPKLTDALKKMMTAALSGALVSEEVVRNYLSELKLPKDILNNILTGAAKSKEELVAKIVKEVMALLQKEDLSKWVSQFAQEHRIKIKAEIEIEPKSAVKSHSSDGSSRTDQV